MAESNVLLEAALRYADLGYRVFPCAPGDNKPITEHGFHNATADPDQIERWWAERPNANVGIPTEGLLALDVDLLDGESNPWLTPERQLDLARAPMQLTPGGGSHYLFRQPEGKGWRNTTSALAPKVDTRADGGYIVVPPSARPDGVYRWQETMALDAPPDRLPEPPDWLVEAVDALGTRAATSTPDATSAADGNPIPSGQRNSTLASLAGTMRRAGMAEPEILAAILETNRTRCQPPLPEAEVRKIASSISRYAPDGITVAVAENHWAQMCEAADDEAVDAPDDPGPIPDTLLSVPGLVGEVIDFCVANAPYPNLGMAFCGAMALQSHLCARKVREPGDLRTNLYLLALASSSAGKNFPRQINAYVLMRIGDSHGLGDKFASGEGIQDELFLHPAKLYQSDEIDGLLQAVNRARDARHESVISTLLTMFTSANTVYPMRSKAGKQSAGVIDQPHLTIFGTATPVYYYEALSERMLNNGFFARMVIVDTGRRGEGQDAGLVSDLPERLLDTARWWYDFQPGEHRGNLTEFHPKPEVVPYADDAKDALAEFRKRADEEYSQAEDRRDEAAKTVWGRANENARKLALLYACSENHASPQISLKAADWAVAFMDHQVRRMLFMAASHVAENPFHADCLKLIRKLREAPDHELSHSVLLKRMKMNATAFRELLQTLEQRGDIKPVQVPTAGRTGIAYRLVRGVKEG